MDFMQRVQNTLSQGLDSSRDLFGKAKEKAKDLSEKGILRFEIAQLERQAADLMGKLGSRVFEVLTIENRASVSAKTEGVKGLIEQIDEVRAQIDRKEDALKDFS